MDLNLRLSVNQEMSPSFGTSSNRERQEQNQLISPLGNDTKNYLSSSEVGNASDNPGPLKGFRNVESRSAGLTMGSRNYIAKPSPLVDLMTYRSQPTGRGLVSNYVKQTSDVLKNRLAGNFKNSNNSLFTSRGNFSSVHPATPMWAGTSQSAISQLQPRGFIPRACVNEGGRSSVPFAICGQEKADYLQSMQAFSKYSDTDPRILKQGSGDYRYQSNSALLLGQEKKDFCSTFKRSEISLVRKDEGSFLMLNNVSPKHNHSQACYQELHQGIQNISQIGHFPSWGSSSKLKMSDQQRCLQTRFQSAHDASTMSTFTPGNSVIRASQGPRMIPDRSLPNRERVSASFCKENRLSEKFEVIDLNKDPSQTFGHNQQGIKLQALDSSTGSGGMASVLHPSAFQFVSTNELSVETGAHDLSGAKPFPANKDVGTNVKISSTGAYVSPEKVWSKPVIPDLNISLPQFPGAGTLMGQFDTSTQKSKSSDRGSLHAIEPIIKTRKKRKMSDGLDSSDSAQQEIVNKSLRQTRKGKRTKSERTFAGKNVIMLDLVDDGPSLNMTHGSSSKELMEVEKQTTSDKNGKTPSGLKPCNE